MFDSTSRKKLSCKCVNLKHKNLVALEPSKNIQNSTATPITKKKVSLWSLLFRMDISAKHKKAPTTQIKNLVGVLEISRVVEDRNK